MEWKTSKWHSYQILDTIKALKFEKQTKH